MRKAAKKLRFQDAAVTKHLQEIRKNRHGYLHQKPRVQVAVTQQAVKCMRGMNEEYFDAVAAYLQGRLKDGEMVVARAPYTFREYDDQNNEIYWLLGQPPPPKARPHRRPDSPGPPLRTLAVHTMCRAHLPSAQWQVCLPDLPRGE